MALDDTVHIHACLFLEIVDILRHTLPHQSLILKHLDKVMRRCRIAGRQVKVLREFVERLWLVDEVVELENGLGSWQIVLR